MSEPKVLDLSHHNTVSDWSEVIESGIVGIIHKATEGSSFVDSTYAQRAHDAQSAGLKWGAYHFLRPGDMRQQAQHFVNTAGDDIELYAADHEDEGVSLNDLKNFLIEVELLTGRKPIIYSGHVLKEQLEGKGRDAALAEYRLWLAHYTSGAPTWPEETWESWWLWQYSDQESCPGCGGSIDCNSYEGTDEQLRTEWAGEEEAPAPAPEPEMETITIAFTVTITAPKGAVITVNGGVT
jgi:lysozyme